MKKVCSVVLLLLMVLSASSYAQKIFFANGAKNKKQIALTFDDGPGANTKEILKILKEKNIKATFFILGDSAKKRPYLVKAIYNEGHEIASHTYHHINFYKDKYDDFESFEFLKGKITEELLRCEVLIETILNIKPKLVRFPHGYMRKPALETAEEYGYKVINWSFGADWKKFSSYEELLELYLQNAEPGTIFLMHDLNKNTKLTEMLPVLIDELKDKGYKFLTVSKLLNIQD